MPGVPTGDPDVDVLKNMSLTIEPGETIAVVGASGSGKSTMASLIPRLYDVTAGSVKIDGRSQKYGNQKTDDADLVWASKLPDTGQR